MLLPEPRDDEPIIDLDCCQWCGARIIQKPVRKEKDLKYCSDKCYAKTIWFRSIVLSLKKDYEKGSKRYASAQTKGGKLC